MRVIDRETHDVVHNVDHPAFNPATNQLYVPAVKAALARRASP